MNCRYPFDFAAITAHATKRLGGVAIPSLVLMLASSSNVKAQDACCFEPEYRLQCETVMEPQTVQRFRLSYETEYVDEQVTSYRPVLKTRTEEREYKVAKPVVETSFREERFTVWKPVVETSYREESVQQTRYVNETSEREEQYVTYRPVVETSYYQQQYAVQRPVTETSYVDQQYMVQRPVVETQMQSQQYTSLRPVTSVQNQTYDAGGYVAQQVVTPGTVQQGLAYVPNAYATPGPLGIFARVRGAYAVVPQVTPPTVQTQMSYRPNYITQQVAQTSYVPETQTVQVPVQVQRMQQEVVSQRVPVQTTRMQTDMVTQNVPVQTTRMVATTEVRKVPFVVQRPITETLTRKVPVQQQRWVTEEQVRKVPVQSTRMVYETRKEPIQVQYYEQEAIVQTVRKPVQKQVYVPYNETVMVPRQMVQKMPISYYDPFSPAIVSGYSSFSPSTSSVPMGSVPYSSSRIITDPSPVVTQPADSMGSSVLESPQSYNAEPESRLQSVERKPLETPSPSEPSANESSPSDADELLPPALNAPKTDDGGTTATEAGWRIRWNPIYARDV
ncbi:hypothetical protein [Rubripirellula tenax]|nr:hypothetical protein [Rubripirellula tenax]